MAGKTKDMSKIKQLLLLHKQGVSNRKAALLIDIDKETANKYINLAKADELPLDALIAMPDPILEYRFRSGNPAYTDQVRLCRQYSGVSQPSAAQQHKRQAAVSVTQLSTIKPNNYG